MNITDLQVRELNIIARRIGGDPLEAVAHGTEHRWTALALAAWLLAKRTDPLASEDTYLNMPIAQLQELVAEADAEDAAELDPTAPTP